MFQLCIFLSGDTFGPFRVQCIDRTRLFTRQIKINMATLLNGDAQLVHCRVCDSQTSTFFLYDLEYKGDVFRCNVTWSFGSVLLFKFNRKVAIKWL